MEKHAETLVRDFITTYLQDNLENLRQFDFKELQNSEKFGCHDRPFDCDDTNIMRAIYVVLWGDLLPNLTMENCGYRKQYRGDTMNTFHTMFGRAIEGRPGFFAGLEKYSPNDALREKVRHFGKLCSNIGNYLVLPNYYANNTTLNCYRGTNDWHDFFDRFLIELYKVQTNAASQDKVLAELVRINNFCFKHFQGKENFQNFLDAMLLTDYCDSQTRLPTEIFAMNYHWMDEKNPEKYFQDSECYLFHTEKIIRSRCNQIIAQLQQKLA